MTNNETKEKNYIAKSGIVKNNELLPMKESPEKEALKSKEQHSEELCNFIKNAFVAEEVYLLSSKKYLAVFIDIKKKEKQTSLVFEVRTLDRGIFYVSMSNNELIN